MAAESPTGLLLMMMEIASSVMIRIAETVKMMGILK